MQSATVGSHVPYLQFISTACSLH